MEKKFKSKEINSNNDSIVKNVKSLEGFLDRSIIYQT